MYFTFSVILIILRILSFFFILISTIDVLNGQDLLGLF